MSLWRGQKVFEGEEENPNKGRRFWVNICEKNSSPYQFGKGKEEFCCVVCFSILIFPEERIHGIGRGRGTGTGRS